MDDEKIKRYQKPLVYDSGLPGIGTYSAIRISYKMYFVCLCQYNFSTLMCRNKTKLSFFCRPDIYNIWIFFYKLNIGFRLY